MQFLTCAAVSAAQRQRPIQRIIGPQRQVRAALDEMNIASDALQLDEPEYLYSLRLSDLKVPPKLQSGEWQGRLMQTDDVELMTRWRVGFSLETMGETESPALWQQMRDGVERYFLRLGRVWILEAGDQPVATSAFNTTTAEIVQVGGVWTPPELRRRGYGRAAVAASLLAVRNEGAHKAILFTGEENIPAQKAYEGLGFTHIGDYRITLLKEPFLPQTSYCLGPTRVRSLLVSQRP